MLNRPIELVGSLDLAKFHIGRFVDELLVMIVIIQGIHFPSIQPQPDLIILGDSIQ